MRCRPRWSICPKRSTSRRLRPRRVDRLQSRDRQQLDSGPREWPRVRAEAAVTVPAPEAGCRAGPRPASAPAPAPAPKPGPGVSVKAPGVEVGVPSQGGVSVKTPGVEVGVPGQNGGDVVVAVPGGQAPAKTRRHHHALTGGGTTTPSPAAAPPPRPAAHHHRAAAPPPRPPAARAPSPPAAQAPPLRVQRRPGTRPPTRPPTKLSTSRFKTSSNRPTMSSTTCRSGNPPQHRSAQVTRPGLSTIHRSNISLRRGTAITLTATSTQSIWSLDHDRRTIQLEWHRPRQQRRGDRRRGGRRRP